MGTDTLTQEQILAAQRKQIEDLQATVARLGDRLGPDPDAAPKPANGFPRLVYRAQDVPNPKQVDHPGWDKQVVADDAALERAIDAGWVTEPGAYVYARPKRAQLVEVDVEADAEPIAVKPGKGKK